MSVKWDTSSLNKLNRATTVALKEYGKGLDADIKEEQVVPEMTGALENSQTIKMENEDTLRISYNTPYAARLYFHPEYKFNRNINKRARGMWLEFIFRGNKQAQKYADILKRKV